MVDGDEGADIWRVEEVGERQVWGPEVRGEFQGFGVVVRRAEGAKVGGRRWLVQMGLMLIVNVPAE